LQEQTPATAHPIENLLNSPDFQVGGGGSNAKKKRGHSVSAPSLYFNSPGSEIPETCDIKSNQDLIVTKIIGIVGMIILRYQTLKITYKKLEGMRTGYQLNAETEVWLRIKKLLISDWLVVFYDHTNGVGDLIPGQCTDRKLCIFILA